MDFDKIPLDIKSFNQWVVWSYEDLNCKKPTKIPYSAINGRPASVKDSDTWASFEKSVSAFNTGLYSGIGFVLTENDPYSFIDLDDPKGNVDTLQKQLEIYNDFDSYAERSPSGSGLHIIVKGSLPSGKRQSSVEIYSSSRYMTMTGDVYRDLPINSHNELLNSLWARMGGFANNKDPFYLGLTEATETDEEIYKRASIAANADKFLQLYKGNWQDIYPSQSEADFALIDIIAFFSKNRKQISRMFAASALGKRDKAKRSDYIDYMLNRCFDRMLPPVDFNGMRDQLDKAIAINKEKEIKKITTSSNEVTSPYSVPPGLIGDISKFIYASAPRPVAEIALAGAIGLMAGIAGRAYNVSGTGLNQYVLLLAPTGTGKEAIASGIDKLIEQVCKNVPSASQFIGPGEIASSQAIIKYMAGGNNSIVSIVGEFGIYLQQMANFNAPPHLVGLRRFLLDIYNKSGEGKVMRPSIYSDKEKNTTSVIAPSFSIMGESTPEKFYEGLHEGLISDGLLPRFTVIEYHGKRPPLNEAHLIAQPSSDLVEKMATLCSYAMTLNSQNKAIRIKLDSEAQSIFDKFNEHCDLNINSSDAELNRQLWNRAHIKALKLAGLVSVGCNRYDPCVNMEIAQWSINIIIADVQNMLDRFESGQVGANNEESLQLFKAISVVKEYLTKPWSYISKYAGEGASSLYTDRVISYLYLHKKLCSSTVFKKDKMGATSALKRAIKTMCESGDLQELSRSELYQKYNTTAIAYSVTNAKSFGL